MVLILGLGNPGPKYELTRHNMGFLVADTLAEKYRISLGTLKHQSMYGKGTIRGCQVMICKPMTYMNESGKTARSLVQAFDIIPDEIIVVHDDIDLPLGKIKRKTKGGDAGQRGVGSIIEKLGTDQFWRVRVGVGRPEYSRDVVDYVLTPFPESDIPQVNEVLEAAVTSVEETIRDINT